MPTTNKSKTLIQNYLVQQVFDPEQKTNKSTKMRNAGYTETSVSKSIQKVEKTLYYAEISAKTSIIAGTSTLSLLNSIESDIQEGVLEKYPLKEKISMLKTLVQVGSILSPSFKQKESFKGEDGSVKNVWTKIN